MTVATGFSLDKCPFQQADNKRRPGVLEPVQTAAIMLN